MKDRLDVGAIDRRLAIGGGLAAAAGLIVPTSQVRSRVITQRGVAGGGLVPFAEGEAEFSLSASRMTTTEEGVESEPIFLGRLRWADGSVGVTLESVRITNYENLQLSVGEGRRVEGDVAAGDAGEQPFLLEVRFDLPESQPDQLTFRVGAAIEGIATPGTDAGYTYAAEGEVVGDLTDADFAVDLETGAVTEPEPD
jgi:hypothetical protein